MPNGPMKYNAIFRSNAFGQPKKRPMFRVGAANAKSGIDATATQCAPQMYFDALAATIAPIAILEIPLDNTSPVGASRTSCTSPRISIGSARQGLKGLRDACHMHCSNQP